MEGEISPLDINFLNYQNDCLLLSCLAWFKSSLDVFSFKLMMVFYYTFMMLGRCLT